jgi:spore germination protein KB
LWGKISTRQLFFIISLSRISIIVVFLPIITITDVLQDAWIAAIVATTIAILLGILVGSLLLRFTRKSFAEISRESLGLTLGIPTGPLVGLLFYFITLLRTRNLAFLIVTSALPEAPDSAIGIMAWLVATYGAYLGPDAMGRSAEFLITIVGLSIVAGFVLLAMSPIRPDIFFLKPVLSRGLLPVIPALANPVFWFLISGGLALGLGKYCVDPARIRRALVTSLLLSGIMLVILSVTVLIYMGPHQSKEQFSPLLSLAHVAFVSGIVERLDILIATLWMLGVVFDVTVLLLVASVILADTFGVRANLTVLVLSGLGLIPLALRLGDPFQIRKILEPGPTALATAVLLGLIGLVFLVSVIRGVGRGRRGLKNG